MPGPPPDPAAAIDAAPGLALTGLEGLDQLQPTAAIAAALAGLEGLDQLEPVEHVGRFDAVHSALTEALSSIDKV